MMMSLAEERKSSYFCVEYFVLLERDNGSNQKQG